MEQTDADFRDIERARDLPPDEPYPSRDDEPDEDETVLADGTVVDQLGNFRGIDQPAAASHDVT